MVVKRSGAECRRSAAASSMVPSRGHTAPSLRHKRRLLRSTIPPRGVTVRVPCSMPKSCPPAWVAHISCSLERARMQRARRFL
eukprot:363384-Chlamydomonas_euryale.AAC.10